MKGIFRRTTCSLHLTLKIEAYTHQAESGGCASWNAAIPKTVKITQPCTPEDEVGDDGILEMGR